MKTTMRLMSVITMLTVLSACASQPAYREANKNGYGYTEQQFSKNQYRVEFRARGDDVGRAIDYAMFRASEIALLNEYDWFAVTSREIRVDNDEVDPQAVFGASTRPQTVTSCGLLGCRSYTHPIQAFDMQTTLGDGRSEVEVLIDVRMGNGIRPIEIESFDTREVHERLQPGDG